MKTGVWINDLKTSPGDDPLPPQAGQLLEPAVGAPTEWWARRGIVTLIGLGVAVVVALLTWPISDALGRKADGPVVVDGLTIFAVFFVAALAIERLLEPLSLFDIKKETLQQEQVAKDSEAVTSARQLSGPVIPPAAVTAAQTKLEAFAAAKVKVDIWSTYRSLVLWGVASIVGAVASALLNLHLLRTAGINPPTVYLDVLATGLIIGAGTKPLHDLTKLLTAAKTSTTGS
ncbi:hypothetical protein [Kibdelosporangium aridum]|uniref:Uncharacterized protein n=1 Tax=Kibdelosporangium aridum TaxID=2030 RepID=A0A1W2FWS6_KIBAR|nr:hypothetical protein [Kibdelosporangium aridum]SMD26409.1 hypothetical protein SAMN05661093_09992 [Kibdelosporangium aridum]